jgi:uncharacterized protein with GYD domain
LAVEVSWTIGQYDVVAFGGGAGGHGDDLLRPDHRLRTETLRAFTQPEIDAILSKLA